MIELHDYQKYAVKFIEEHPVSALLLDMGLGKTITTLTAINNLMFDMFEVRKVLIIGPLRVARDTWPTEIEKWKHLRHLRYSVAVGTAEERIAALNTDADIYIINRENVDWLVSNTKFDYDMVVIDELSSFKNHQSKRFKALMKVRPKVKRIVGLTGTPASNGLMDLFAEFRLLDMGERLGRFIGQYRNEYFKPDKQNGYIVYSYKPLPDAEERIYEKISDITVSMKAVDHLKMPELVSNEYTVKMSEAKEYMEQARYLDMQINSKIEQVRTLNELATKVTTVYSDMPHSPNKNTGRMEETIAKIIDLESEIDRDIDALVDLKQEVKTAISKVEDEKYRVLLELRYINQKSWEEIANQLGYDLRYTHKIHGRALQKITVPEKRH